MDGPFPDECLFQMDWCLLEIVHSSIAGSVADMQLDKLLNLFEGSAAIKLLRSPLAPYISSFLYDTFRRNGQTVWEHEELAAALSSFCQELHSHDETVLRESPETYLRQWSRRESRWLERRLTPQARQPQYSLSHEAEQVLQFLDGMTANRLNFVGTESRLCRILDTLSQLAVRGSDDPQQRLAYLLEQRQQIDNEIDELRQGKAASRLTRAAIRERFEHAVRDFEQLQGDFRAVEESFLCIARDVLQRSARGGGNRGSVLGYALEAEESLKNEDQAVSFYEFVRLVLSPMQQESLQEALQRIRSFEELQDQTASLGRFEEMIPRLLTEAERVLATTRRLSTAMRRILDARSAPQRARVGDVLADIKRFAVQLSSKPPREEITMTLDVGCKLQCPAERVFWAPSDEPITTAVVAVANEDEDDRLAAFKQLAQLQRLDWERIRRCISEQLRIHPAMTLPQLLSLHPPQAGVLEVLGFIQIAADDGHEVHADVRDLIPMPEGDPVELAQSSLASMWRIEGGHQGPLTLNIPRVVFQRQVKHARQPRRRGTAQRAVPSSASSTEQKGST